MGHSSRDRIQYESSENPFGKQSEELDKLKDTSKSSCVNEPVLVGFEGGKFESRLENSFCPQYDREITIVDPDGNVLIYLLEDLQFLAFVNIPLQIDLLNINTFTEVIKTFSGALFKVRVPNGQDFDSGFFGIVTDPEDRYKYIFFPFNNIRIQYQQRLIGDIFVEKNFLSKENLQNVLSKQKQLRNLRLGSIIAKRLNFKPQHVERILQKALKKRSDKKLQQERERLLKEADENLQQELKKLLKEANKKLRLEEELLKKEIDEKLQQVQKELQIELDEEQGTEKERQQKEVDAKLQLEKKKLQIEAEKKKRFAEEALRKEADEKLLQEQERLRKLAERKLQLVAEWLKTDAEEKRPTGDILVEAGLVSSQAVKQSLEIQKRMRHIRVGELLVELGYINEGQMYRVLAEKFHKRFVSLQKTTPTDEALSFVPRNVMSKLGIIPMYFQNERLVIATSNPDNTKLSDMLKKMLSCPFELVITPLNEIIETLKKLSG